MSASLPVVSIIMPVRNAESTLGRAIDSILEQTYQNIDQIILAIGPSADSTMSIAHKYKMLDTRIEIINNESGLTASGLNKAASLATSDFLVRVDSHCAIPKDYVAKAVEIIIRTKAGNVGGIQNAIGETTFQIAVATAMSSRFGVGNSKFHYGGKEGPTDTVYLGIYDSKLFKMLGGFNESLVRNQDYELNNRIRRAGRKVWFDPQLIVDYFPRSDLSSLSAQYFQYGKWKRKVIFKDPSSLKVRQTIPPLTVLILIASLALSFIASFWFLTVLLFYLAVTIGVSVFKQNITFRQRLALFLVFPTMHISWGVGFLIGLTK